MSETGIKNSEIFDTELANPKRKSGMSEATFLSLMMCIGIVITWLVFDTFIVPFMV